MADRVLLVDDEKEFTDVLAQRMETRGVEVDVAPTGTDALEKIEERSYDAIILDLLMPGIDGIETCRQMLEKNPDLQIILLSGHATVDKSVEAIKLGAMDFLEKPADIQTLMERIGSAKTNKMLLVEKKNEERIRDILRSKGW
jgi:DNA-binding NtrC family response regulator